MALRIINNFFKKRVLHYSLTADRVMTEMVKQPLEEPGDYFFEIDSMTYYELKFYSLWARKNINKQIDEDIIQASQKLIEFDELYKTMRTLNSALWEFQSLYFEIQNEITTHNFWNRTEMATEHFEKNLEESIIKYIDLLKQLEDYPDWKEKAQNEIGYFVHLIYNTALDLKKGDHIFHKFDKHYYFK